MFLPLALLTFMAASDNQLIPGDQTRSLEVDKRPRTYLVHIPLKHDPKKPTPVVLIFHGGGSNAEQMVRFCGLNETADKQGFIVVYPNGTGRLTNALTWNDGNCCGSPCKTRSMTWPSGKGKKNLPSINFYSVEYSIRAWVKANGYKVEPATVKLPDKANDGTTATIKTYGGGKDGAEVVLVVIEGGGHTWPGRQPLVRFLGKSTQNVSANDLMWEFFEKHRMK